jgi:CheY-like chemotaxis protein
MAEGLEQTKLVRMYLMDISMPNLDGLTTRQIKVCLRCSDFGIVDAPIR